MSRATDIALTTAAVVAIGTGANVASNAAIEAFRGNIKRKVLVPTFNLGQLHQGILGVTVPVLIMNQNPVNLWFDHFKGTVSYGDLRAQIQTSTNIVIPANDGGGLNINFTIDVTDTVNQSYNAVRQGGWMGGIRIFFNNVELVGDLILLKTKWGNIGYPVEIEFPVFP